MRVNTNMNAMVAHSQMTKNTALSGNSMEKISSGLRITKAGDDAAGLAISEKMRAQIRGMEQAARNTQDGISMIQTAEGGAEEIGNILQRMRELAVQGANETNDTTAGTDVTKIENELTALSDEITRITDSTKFNGKTLLDGSYKAGGATNLTLQVGANGNTTGTAAEQTIVINIEDIDAAALKVDSAALTVKTNVEAQKLIDTIDTAIGTVNGQRANLDAYQNRLEYAQNNLTTSTENLTAAESRIRDVDVAKEMMNLSKLNILSQAAQAMIGQAKQQPEGVLQLLR